MPAQRQAEAQALFQRQQVQLGLADPRAAEVSERGVPVTGVVMSMIPTGEIRQGYTGLDATVRFTNSYGNLVERSKRVFLPQSMLGQLGVGRQVDMRVLPDDDTQFIFELNSVDAASWWRGRRREAAKRPAKPLFRQRIGASRRSSAAPTLVNGSRRSPAC